MLPARAVPLDVSHPGRLAMTSQRQTAARHAVWRCTSALPKMRSLTCAYRRLQLLSTTKARGARGRTVAADAGRRAARPLMGRDATKRTSGENLNLQIRPWNLRVIAARHPGRTYKPRLCRIGKLAIPACIRPRMVSVEAYPLPSFGVRHRCYSLDQVPSVGTPSSRTSEN
jgi:hypothetical protein